MATPRDLAEIACSEAITEVLNAVSSKTRVSAFNLAVRVPGACHTHPPTKNVVPGCAYCARRGNVFSGNTATSNVAAQNDVAAAHNDVVAAYNDVVAAYVKEITSALEKLQQTVRDTLDGNYVAPCDAGDAACDDVEFDELDDALFKAMTEDM